MALIQRIAGAREIDELLKKLPVRVAKRVVGNAMRAGGRVVQREAKLRAPVGIEEPHPKYGKLRDNIRVKTVAEKGTSAAVAVHIGAAFWGFFLEFGTGVRRLKKARVLSDGTTVFGTEVGPMPARPFMRPAWDSSKAAALDRIAKGLGDGIQREAIKLGGKPKAGR